MTICGIRSGIYTFFAVYVLSSDLISSGILLQFSVCSTEVKGDEPYLEDGSQTVLHVDSLGHVLHAFVNGKLEGDGTKLFF